MKVLKQMKFEWMHKKTVPFQNYEFSLVLLGNIGISSVTKTAFRNTANFTYTIS